MATVGFTQEKPPGSVPVPAGLPPALAGPAPSLRERINAPRLSD